MSVDPGEVVDRTVRRERVALLAALYRLGGDLGLAEEALQEGCVRALRTWPRDGVPERPGAWLHVVARRWMIDRLRRRRPTSPLPEDHPAPIEGQPTDDREDRLQLLFACCAVELPEKILLRVASCAWISSPMTLSQPFTRSPPGRARASR